MIVLGCRYGSAMFHAGPHLWLKNNSFENNTCVVNGGAIYIKSRRLDDGSWADGKGVDVLACSFKNNTAGLRGGAVYYLGSLGSNNEKLLVRETLFAGNNGTYGGALCTWAVSSLVVNETAFEENTALLGRGGGIYTGSVTAHSGAWQHLQSMSKLP